MATSFEYSVQVNELKAEVERLKLLLRAAVEIIAEEFGGEGEPTLKRPDPWEWQKYARAALAGSDGTQTGGG